MNSGTITSGTYIRNLNYGIRRKLSDFLDPQDSWKDVIVSIKKPSGEPRYSQHHVRRFEALVPQGKSPTIELLNDWGTTNCTVGELVDILKSCQLLAPASLLLPDMVKESKPLEKQTQVSPAFEPHHIVTRVLGETDRRSPPVSCHLQPEVLPEHPEPEHPEPEHLEPEHPEPEHPEPEHPEPEHPEPEHPEPEHTGFSRFSYHQLAGITGNFDERPAWEGGSRLGEGGFGTVYKGLVEGKPVAVKKLNPMEDISLEDLRVQFNQEIQTLTLLQHDNLVDMVGYSSDGHHPCLVYAYMANGSLLDRLACLEDSPPLSWAQRCVIAVGTARGLEYLHSRHHVHRDVKSGNILLDENFVAKISDFGLTRASAKRSSTTMMTERIVGTRAYMAPEALRGEITPKSDIFSFGVVLLEILSGLPPVDESRDPQFLMELRYDIEDEDEELTLEDFLDKKMGDFEHPRMESMYSLSCNCLHDRRTRRPVMEQVLSELEAFHGSIRAQ